MARFRPLLKIRVVHLRHPLLWYTYLAAFFSSCSPQTAWHCTSIPNDQLAHRITLLSYTPKDPVNGITLELVRHGNEVRGYLLLNYYTFPLDAAELTTIELATASGSEQFAVTPRKGGQRVRLPQQAVDYAIAQLSSGSNLTIRCGYFKQVVLAACFKRHYDQLLASSSFFLSREKLNMEWLGQ